MKIVLSTAPREWEVVQNVNPKYVLNDFIKYPPLALLSIVRTLDRSRHELLLLDANEWTMEALAEKIITAKPDLFGISLVTERFYGALTLVRRLRQALPGLVVVGGGPHTDLYPQETMTHPEFDYLLTGPCETTFPLFVEWLSSGQACGLEQVVNLYYREQGELRTTTKKSFKNIDEFSLPDRTCMDIRKYASVSDRGITTTMNSSRGCPFRCNFCNVPRYYLQRSAEKVLEEIQEILALGFNEIHILDDTFNINKSRVLKICDLIVRRGVKFRWSTRARLNPFDDEMAAAMKAAGCFRLNVGVESHDPGILSYINKKISYDDLVRGFQVIHRHGFESLAYFIIGFPGQTYHDAMKTMEFIRKIQPTFILINTLLPTPASDFYNQLVRDGVYQRDHWKEYVLNPSPDFVLPSWRGADQDLIFLRAMDELMRNFYLSPGFVLREMAGDIRNGRFSLLGRKIKLGLEMLFHRETSADELEKRL